VVVRTKPQRELYAADNLARQGYEYYLPRILVHQVNMHRIIPQPLFPCYIFVHVVDRWRSLLSTYGVLSLVTHGSSPAIIPDTEIQKLKQREDDNGFVLLEEAPAGFRPGDTVRVKEGLHAGTKGIYDGVSARDRVRVLMDYLGRKTKVLISEEALELDS